MGLAFTRVNTFKSKHSKSHRKNRKNSYDLASEILEGHSWIFLVVMQIKMSSFNSNRESGVRFYLWDNFMHVQVRSIIEVMLKFFFLTQYPFYSSRSYSNDASEVFILSSFVFISFIKLW